MFGMAFGGGGNRNNNSGSQIVLIELTAMAVSFIIYLISWLLTLALSRYRELSADRSGAILIGKPSVLASALQRITGDISRIPQRDLRRVQTMNAFFFAPALSGNSLHGLLATHPSLEFRLAKLAELERELGQP